MQLSVYSVKDEKSGFNNPFICTNDAIALRDFSSACVSKDSMLAKFPEDFNLYRIGTFNNENGFVDSSVPVLIAKAIDLIDKE